MRYSAWQVTVHNAGYGRPHLTSNTMKGRGIGADEQWTLLVVHNDDEIDRQVEVSEEFAKDVFSD